MRTTVRELKAAHKRNMDTLTDDFLRERAKDAAKIDALTKENAKIAFDATEGFNKLVASIGERDNQIRTLTTQATILQSDLEAAAGKFVEVENSRDVYKHLEAERVKVIAGLTKEIGGLEGDVGELKDERATLMAALKRIVRE
jgi:ABC-type transporter Mla subunit MlaD